MQDYARTLVVVMWAVELALVGLECLPLVTTASWFLSVV